MALDENFFKNVLDNLYDGVYYCDKDRKITYWNGAAEKMTGYKAEDVVGTHCWDNILMHTNMKGERLCSTGTCPAVVSMQKGKLVEEEVYLKHKEGYRIPISTRISPIKDDKDEIVGAVEIFYDNSAKVSAFEKIEKLEKLAFIDALTGVGNRRYTEIKIGAKLEEIDRYAWAGPFGLMFLDIDHFKDINDKYGHEAGDEVLKMVANTVLKNLREDDFIGRWGGEEFVALISNMDRKKLYAIAEKMRGLVESSTHDYGRDQLKVTVSIGTTMAKSADSMDQLIKRADLFMYECKRNGRNCVTIG